MATNPAKINLKNIWKFITGWIRYILYKATTSKYLKKIGADIHLLPEHQIEQFKWRIQQVTQKSPKCLEDGKCVICGCETPQLQMASPKCEGNCYPDMMDADAWKKYKSENQIKI